MPWAFYMERVVKPFAEYHPLERCILEAAKITVPVDTPTKRKMIKDYMVAIFGRKNVWFKFFRLVFVT